MKARTLSIALALCACSLEATTIVPGGFAATSAPSQGISPLSVGSAFFGSTITGRWQQIYSSAEFGGVVAGEAVTSIAFRQDEANGFQGGVDALQDVEVYLTTTPTAVNGLSVTYANNNNASTTLVYSGPVTFDVPFDSGNPRQFSYLFNLETPYLYNPADGNLMLDIIVRIGNDPNLSSIPTLDFARDTSPVMSLVVHYSMSPTGWNQAAGTAVANSGWVTQFGFAPVPEPSTLGLGFAALGLVVLAKRRR